MMLRNEGLSAELTPNSQQDWHSKVPSLSLWFSPTRSRILEICTLSRADRVPFGSFTGAVKGNVLKSLMLIQSISQSRTPASNSRILRGEPLAIKINGKISAESHISHLSLLCFQWATEKTQLVS